MSKAQDKPVAVVTGASGGIGQAVIRCLQRDGWAVAATSLEIAGDVSDLTIPADLTDRDAPGRIMAQTVQQFGRLDGLVNCAGTSAVSLYHEQVDGDWDSFLDINLSAAFRVTKAFIAEALEQPPAPRSIVLISSLAAIAGGANPAFL